MIRSPASQIRFANLLTYLGVSAAAIGITFASGPATRSWGGLGIAIAIACDFFDGRFARLFRRTEEEKRIGVELDSLADVISFGLAPPVCLLRVISLNDTISRIILLVAGLLYLICIVTRLAHYNVAQAGSGAFVGLPSPIPALFCAILLLWLPGPMLTATVLVLGGAAAVGGFRMPRPNRVVFYTIFAISIMVAAAHVVRLLSFPIF